MKDFVQCVSGSSSLYGLQPDTLESLVLTLLPPLGHKYDTLGEPSLVDSSMDIRVYVLQELLQSLRHCAGFHIPPVSFMWYMYMFISGVCSRGGSWGRANANVRGEGCIHMCGYVRKRFLPRM